MARDRSSSLLLVGSSDDMDRRLSAAALPGFLQRRIQFRAGEDNAPSKKQRFERDQKEELFSAENVILGWSRIRNIGPGLNNLGNTCYLNSVIQCLTYTAPFAELVLNHACRAEGFCLLCLVQKQLHASLESEHNARCITPTAIVSHLKLIGKHFRLGRQEDSHEFLRFMVEGMQRSCLSGLDKHLDARVKETSLIYRIFGGYLQSKVVCGTCNHESITIDPFLDLSLDVRNAQSVPAALDVFTSPETLCKANRYRCDTCDAYADATKHLQIHSAPNILTIHLKRFYVSSFGQINKISREVSFDTTLSLAIANNSAVSYGLYAVLVHEGQTCNSGHYHCFVKNSNGSWYSMNDSSVSQVSLQTVLRQRAYMLFYQKCPKPIDQERTGDDSHNVAVYDDFIQSSSMWYLNTAPRANPAPKRLSNWKVTFFNK